MIIFYFILCFISVIISIISHYEGYLEVSMIWIFITGYCFNQVINEYHNKKSNDE